MSVAVSDEPDAIELEVSVSDEADGEIRPGMKLRAAVALWEFEVAV